MAHTPSLSSTLRLLCSHTVLGVDQSMVVLRAEVRRCPWPLAAALAWPAARLAALLPGATPAATLCVHSYPVVTPWCPSIPAPMSPLHPLVGAPTRPSLPVSPGHALLID